MTTKKKFSRKYFKHSDKEIKSNELELLTQQDKGYNITIPSYVKFCGKGFKFINNKLYYSDEF